MQDLMECFKEGVAVVDENWKFISINDKGCEAIGLKREKVIGKDCAEIFPTCFKEEVLKRKNSIFNKKTTIKTGDGEMPVYMSVVPILEKGKLKGAVVYFRSVNECFDCIKKFKEREQIFKTIFDSVADGIFTINENWEITAFNNAAERITGYSKEEVLGIKCYKIFQSLDCQNTCPLKLVMEKRIAVTKREMVIRKKNGMRIPVLVSASFLKNENGKVIGCVEIFREIQDTKLIGISEKDGFDEIIGRSLKMRSIFEKIPVIANSDLNVLIEGETGTGKDLLARVIHRYSPRNRKPFITVSCPSIPDTLLESELFGYKKGAFTGAISDKPGKFEICNGGTIYLDEVGDIPLHLQVKLLRVIEEHEFEKLGDNSPIKVDVRIIAATNKNLEEEVKKGNFREDLYYRLNVLNIRLPPLRERKEDIPLLIEHLIDKLSKKRGKEVIGIEEKAMEILCSYEWPGNVRELQNVFEYIFVHINSRVIGVNCLPPYLRQRRREVKIGSLSKVEKELIINALRDTGYNKKEVARILGISRTTLWRKMKKYGINI